MTVYVDDMLLQASVPNGSRTVTSQWSHLFADTETELHLFAARLGLRREWAQYPGTAKSHYDVTAGKRRQALAMGAQPMSWREAGEFIATRAQEPPPEPEHQDEPPTLAEETDRRLREAGITEDAPGLVAIREWNRQVREA